jgi:hypothetical protein
MGKLPPTKSVRSAEPGPLPPPTDHWTVLAEREFAAAHHLEQEGGDDTGRAFRPAGRGARDRQPGPRGGRARQQRVVARHRGQDQRVVGESDVGPVVRLAGRAGGLHPDQDRLVIAQHVQRATGAAGSHQFAPAIGRVDLVAELAFDARARQHHAGAVGGVAQRIGHGAGVRSGVQPEPAGDIADRHVQADDRHVIGALGEGQGVVAAIGVDLVRKRLEPEGGGFVGQRLRVESVAYRVVVGARVHIDIDGPAASRRVVDHVGGGQDVVAPHDGAGALDA